MDSTPPASSRRLPAERRRRQLLAVALEMFGSGGYHATSMEDIAERAGVTKPVLYQHFPSKSDLYLELVDAVGDELCAAVATSAAAESAPFARVLAGFRAYFRFVGERTAAFSLLFGRGARQSDAFDDAVRRVEESIAGTIGPFIEADIDEAHRELLGYAIVGLAEVTSRQWIQRRDDGPEDPEAVLAEADVLAQRLADLVWAGLRALPGAPGRERRE